ncbi:MAG: cohesin domain-containing protein [candidate division KSB1 bacterium]|nr:cohesin domain-containing protein [candidate division KSB1 bacterium]
MKKSVTAERVLLLLGAAVIFHLLSCAEAPTMPTGSNDAALSASLQLSQKHYSAAALDSLVLRISYTDKKGNPVTKKYKLTLDSLRTAVKLQVPAEKQLEVSVTGYQDSTAVLYGSRTVFPINKGKSADVRILLDFLVPTIILSPPDTTLQAEQTVTLFLAARNVVDLATFGCLVRFDPTVLQVVELGREDAFLKGNHGNVTQLEFMPDNVRGTVRAVFGVFPASAAVSGSGKLARIVFRALKADTTNVQIQVDNRVNSDLGLFNKNAELMYSVGLGSRLFIKGGQ